MISQVTHAHDSIAIVLQNMLLLDTWELIKSRKHVDQLTRDLTLRTTSTSFPNLVQLSAQVNHFLIMA